MPPSRISLRIQAVLTIFYCFVFLFSISSHAAEEELVILTIEGDLIGKIETLDNEEDYSQIISNYYLLLPTEVQAQIETLHFQLSALIPDYEVAYLAADSAELSEVMDEIDVLWNSIRMLHTQYFTAEVVELLNQALSSVFRLPGTKLPVLDSDKAE